MAICSVLSCTTRRLEYTGEGGLHYDTDILVVGGGINGAGIARDAAGRGLSVTLCEQDDLAAHTSSASTTLIHGGLRYLAQGQFGLALDRMPAAPSWKKPAMTRNAIG